MKTWTEAIDHARTATAYLANRTEEACMWLAEFILEQQRLMSAPPSLKEWADMAHLARGVDAINGGKPLPLTKLFGDFIREQYDMAVAHVACGSPTETALTLAIVQARCTELLLENRRLSEASPTSPLQMAMSFTDAARVLTARIRELEAVSVDVDVIADPDPMLATARLRVNGLGIAAWTGRCANDSTPEAYALEVARCLKKALKMHASAHVKRAWDRSSRASCATCEGSQRVCEDPLHHRYSTLLGLAVCLKNCADSRECPDCETKGK